MPSNAQFAFFHGKMLPQICEVIGVDPTRDNQHVVKQFIKRMYKIDSLASLDTIGMMHLITQTAIFFATEFGFSLDLPGEEGVDDMDLKEMLKLTYHGK